MKCNSIIFVFISINCFELTNILAGKFLTKMFDSTTNKSDLELSNKEFLCETSNSDFIKVIESFFNINCKDTKYTLIDPGKIIINTQFTSEKLKLQLLIFKISEFKLVCSFSIQEGTKWAFSNIMKNIEISNKQLIPF